MRDKKLWISSVLLLVLMLTVTLWADTNTQGADKEKGSRKNSMHSLNLTPDQIKQRQALQIPFQKAMIDLQAKMKNKQLDLRVALKEDTPDTAKVDGLINDLSAIHADIMKAVIHNQLAMKALLTPEQKAKLASFRTNEGIGMSMEMGLGMQHRPGMRPQRSFAQKHAPMQKNEEQEDGNE